MKQVILNFKTGELDIEEVPTPALQPGGVLVRTHYSLISAGTETMAVDLASKSLLGKARARPDLVKKVMDKARKDGPITAFQQAMSRLDKPEPMGYSCAGVVVAVGEGVHDLRVGDAVACAGVGYASHAEVNYVPRNLCVKVAPTVDLRHAAFTTLGAIAMQGVRIGDVRLGERAVVIGLGLLGQLTVQLLKAAGCHVTGVDLDPSKVALAQKLGADVAFTRSTPDLENKVLEVCGGVGADVVLITAATTSNDPIEFAGDIARNCGRVVAVGAVKLDVPRNLFYEKELSVHLSRSYGPGRYDAEYEEEGRDYPIEYVRWTENRNMESFVALLGSGALDLAPLITHEFPVEEANHAYDILSGKTPAPYLGMLLRYEHEHPLSDHVQLAQQAPPAATAATGRVRLGVLGAGTFATSTLLPAARHSEGIELHALATATGMTSKKVGERFGFRHATTDTTAVIQDASVDAIAILTRNSLHAPLAVAALKANKHVFVEKPLAVTSAELDAIIDAWQSSGAHLFVGFNRRYSPFGTRLRDFFGKRTGPLMALYRVNAESIPANHWIYSEKEGGGRLITEACHFIDLLQFVVGCAPKSVYAQAAAGQGGADPRIRENMTITISFVDGSVGTILYTNAGDAAYGKEYAEFFADGASASLRDFRELRLVRGGRSDVIRHRLTQQKGHKEELAAFAALCRRPKTLNESQFWDAVATTKITFAAAESLLKDAPVQVLDEPGR